MWSRSAGSAYTTLATPISLPISGVVNLATYAPAGARYVVLEGYAVNTWASAYNDEMIRIGGIVMCSQRASGSLNYIGCQGTYQVASYSVEVLASNDGVGWFSNGWLRIVGWGK